jgi:hypothetical protein
VSHFTLVADAISLMPNFLLQFTGRYGNGATELQYANVEFYVSLLYMLEIDYLLKQCLVLLSLL